MSNRIDWEPLLSFALSDLRLSPDDFWALTPYEFMLMAGCRVGGAETLSRAGLNALMVKFPDKDTEKT